MAYFDPTKETEMVTDASPSGLSAILTQKTLGKDDKRIVADRCLQLLTYTEGEVLAIVWTIERLHVYLYIWRIFHPLYRLPASAVDF